MNAMFSNIIFVLVAPRMAANVGSVARAIKTMGFSQLVLVKPPDDGFQATFNFKLDHPEAIALASSAQDILANARIVNTLDEALYGCTQSIALTARPREWSGKIVELPQYTVEIAQRLGLNKHLTPNCTESVIEKIAYVFGNERFGLSNTDVMRCTAICSLCSNPDYSSLNVSQAVQIVAYSQRIALMDYLNADTALNPLLSRELANEPLANHQQIQGLIEHWLCVLTAVNYYNPNCPRRLKERLSSLWSRANLTQSDIDLLRGMVSALYKTNNLHNK